MASASSYVISESRNQSSREAHVCPWNETIMLRVIRRPPLHNAISLMQSCIQVPYAHIVLEIRMRGKTQSPVFLKHG